VWYGFLAVGQSFSIGEHSVNEQGLPFTFVVKLALPLSFSFMLIVALIRLIELAFREPRACVATTKKKKLNHFVKIKIGVSGAIVIAVMGLAWCVGNIDPRYALVVLMFTSFVGLLFTGYPIAFVLGGVAVSFIFVGYAADYFGYTLTLDHAGTKLYLGSAAGFVNRIYGGLLRKPELVALPMFIFMGLLLDRSGIAERMMLAMQQVFGQIRGGLAICVVFIGILLAASTGIIGASVVLLGLIGLPVMLQQGYARSVATGTVCSAGTLGILMPPSIMLVIMADQASVPVGDLFMGAILPSALLAGLYVIYLFCIGQIQPEYVPVGIQQSISMKPFRDALLAILPVLALIIIVLGSIFAGVATVTEASGLGAVGASILAIVHWLQINKPRYGKVDYAAILREGWKSCIDAFALTGSIVGILIGATCFAFILRELGGDKLIQYGLESLPFGPFGVTATVLGIIFFLGFFLDWIEITIIVLPLILATIGTFEFQFVDPSLFERQESFLAARTHANTIWFCVLMAVCLQTSFLTPPVGFAIFYLKSVASQEIKLIDIYKGVIPFVVIQLFGLALVFFFGQYLVLWLPQYIYGR
jgi:tripartite ATP-independent transporter DctM subunit